MKVEHSSVTITVEGDEERRFLTIALLIARELAYDAVRAQEVGPILVRAGVEPSNVREAGAVAGFAETLAEGL